MADLSPRDVFGGQAFLDQLIEELEGIYPHHHPLPTDDLATVMYKSGQRSVVEYLYSLKDNVPT